MTDIRTDMRSINLHLPRFALWLSWSLSLAALGCGYSEDRLRCTDDCQLEHDQCVLHSTSAQQLQGCDQETNQCTVACSQY